MNGIQGFISVLMCHSVKVDIVTGDDNTSGPMLERLHSAWLFNIFPKLIFIIERTDTILTKCIEK